VPDWTEGHIAAMMNDASSKVSSSTMAGPTTDWVTGPVHDWILQAASHMQSLRL